MWSKYTGHIAFASGLVRSMKHFCETSVHADFPRRSLEYHSGVCTEQTAIHLVGDGWIIRQGFQRMGLVSVHVEGQRRMIYHLAGVPSPGQKVGICFRKASLCQLGIQLCVWSLVKTTLGQFDAIFFSQQLNC